MLGERTENAASAPGGCLLREKAIGKERRREVSTPLGYRGSPSVLEPLTPEVGGFGRAKGHIFRPPGKSETSGRGRLPWKRDNP